MNKIDEMNQIENIMELAKEYRDAIIEDGVKRQALRAAIEQALTPGEPDVAGAIENGRVYADKLEADYNFECEAGPLRMCSDWVEFRRCFEWLCENITAPQPQPKQGPKEYDHGPQAKTLAEAERDVRKWLNERPNRPIDLRHVAMLVYHAQQLVEQEPIGEVRKGKAYFYNGLYTDTTDLPDGTNLYTSPKPQREWAGLTEEEKNEFVGHICDYGTGFVAPLFATIDSIEAKLREKNRGTK